MAVPTFLSKLLLGAAAIAGCSCLQGCQNKTLLAAGPAPPLLPAPPLPPLPSIAPLPTVPPPAPPAPALGAAGASPRLIVRNACPTLDIWIASSGNVPAPRNVRIAPNAEYKYHIPDAGLSSTRFWPKLWCDASGQSCALGSSGGDGQDCPKNGCAPPVDSKFEASFGAVGVDCARNNKGCDWWDTSAVDGFSLPYKIEIDERCPQGKNIDCIGLSLGQCPQEEWLGEGVGTQDLRVIDPVTKKVVGCYSPCGKLSYSNWENGVGRNSPQSEVAKMFCCPTPPVSPEQCRTGPVEHTKFVKLIHESCPNVYGYAYDDAVGLQVCPAGTTYIWSIGCPEEHQVFS